MKYRPLFLVLELAIRREFSKEICENTDVCALILNRPVELAYSLALIRCNDFHSVTPPWVTKDYPAVESVMKTLQGRPCRAGYPYCWAAFGIHRKLKESFGFDQFRSYGGEPLQELSLIHI